MINRVLTSLSQQMESYVSAFFYQPEGLVEIASISEQGEEEPNKLIISLLSFERENVQGSASVVNKGGGNVYGASLPPIYMNMYIAISAAFSDKRYRESLSVLTQAIAFIQTTPNFIVPSEGKYTIELVNTSWQDLSNIWSGLGKHYYPSVICKIRRLTFSAEQISQTRRNIKGADTTLK